MRLQLLILGGAIALGACGSGSDQATSDAARVATTETGADGRTTTAPSVTTAPPADPGSSAVDNQTFPADIAASVRACTALLRGGKAMILEYRATGDTTDLDEVSLTCGTANDAVIRLSGGGDPLSLELTKAGNDFYDEVEDSELEVDDWAARADAIDALIPL